MILLISVSSSDLKLWPWKQKVNNLWIDHRIILLSQTKQASCWPLKIIKIIQAIPNDKRRALCLSAHLWFPRKHGMTWLHFRKQCYVRSQNKNAPRWELCNPDRKKRYQKPCSTKLAHFQSVPQSCSNKKVYHCVWIWIPTITDWGLINRSLWM